MAEAKACSVDLSFAEVGYLREAVMVLQAKNDKTTSYDSDALWRLYFRIDEEYVRLKKLGWRWTGDGDSTEFNPDHVSTIRPLSDFPDA